MTKRQYRWLAFLGGIITFLLLAFCYMLGRVTAGMGNSKPTVIPLATSRPNEAVPTASQEDIEYLQCIGAWGDRYDAFSSV